MAGTAPALDSTAAGAMGGTDTSATDPSVSGSVKSPAQVLSELAASLTTLIESPLTTKNQVERNAEIAKIREQIAKAQKDTNAENARIVQLRAQIHSETEGLRT